MAVQWEELEGTVQEVIERIKADPSKRGTAPLASELNDMLEHFVRLVENEVAAGPDIFVDAQWRWTHSHLPKL